MTKVLVCGGGAFEDEGLVHQAMDVMHIRRGPFTKVIHGLCPKGGVDIFAGNWGRLNGIEVEEYPIEPGEGGFRRNGRMLATSKPDLGMAFPGGNGTRDMAERLQLVRVPLIFIRADGSTMTVEPVNERGRVVHHRREEYDVLIDRSTGLGNPFTIGVDGTREEVIARFEVYAREMLESGAWTRESILALRGQRLGCWCAPRACHGDVLLNIAEELYNESLF